MELPDYLPAAVRRLVRHLPEQNDLTLIVLKGHLLVEQQMLDIVRVRAVPSEMAKIERMNFFALTRVTRAYVGADSPDQCWDAVDLLNQLRNQLAHQLESAKIAELLDRFFELVDNPAVSIVLVETRTPSTAPDPLEDRLKGAITLLLGRLLNLVSP